MSILREIKEEIEISVNALNQVGKRSNEPGVSLKQYCFGDSILVTHEIRKGHKLMHWLSSMEMIGNSLVQIGLKK